MTNTEQRTYEEEQYNKTVLYDESEAESPHGFKVRLSPHIVEITYTGPTKSWEAVCSECEITVKYSNFLTATIEAFEHRNGKKTEFTKKLEEMEGIVIW